MSIFSSDVILKNNKESKSDRHTKILLYVLYDGITNSVFESQILAPLIHKKKEYKAIILLSFEKETYTQEQIDTIIPPSCGIICIIKKRIPFFGPISLRYATWHIKKIIQTYENIEIYARGPLAGYAALCAKYTHPLVIQARGLAAEEYAYTHAHASRPFSWLHNFRTYLYEQLEKKVYSCNQTNVQFQSVSSALATYLINHFKASTKKIVLAHHDIPQKIPHEKRVAWRIKTRNELGIALNAPVYCYNGSYKSWQCPEKTLLFFTKKLKKNPQSTLLILTPDATQFKNLIMRIHIKETSVYIRTVTYQNLYRYLAAADYGIIFREKHILNWVARPTKIGEYEAVGLSIIHNDTIELLTSKKGTCNEKNSTHSAHRDTQNRRDGSSQTMLCRRK